MTVIQSPIDLPAILSKSVINFLFLSCLQSAIYEAGNDGGHLGHRRRDKAARIKAGVEPLSPPSGLLGAPQGASEFFATVASATSFSGFVLLSIKTFWSTEFAVIQSRIDLPVILA